MKAKIFHYPGYDIIDDYGDDQFEITSPKKLDAYLEKILSKKKRFAGKELLPLIVEALNNELELKFVENNLFTVLGFCLQFIIKGPSTERQLALNALGLLAMTIDNEDDARELYRSSLAVLSETLNSGTETLKILDSLAMITFFCANYSNETEEPMKIIWTFLDADSDNEVARKHSSAVLAAAISAWSFLLTTMETWRLNEEHWQGAISYFTNVLEEGDESVHVAAAEALAQIFEIDCLKKFSTLVDCSLCEEDRTLMEGLLKEELKNTIAEKLKARDEDSARQGTFANLDVLNYFENGTAPEAFTIGEDGLELYTWSQVLRVNFLKNLLGEDRVEKHIMEKEYLHYIFSVRPTTFNPSNVELYIPFREEATVRYFYKTAMSPNSFIAKKRTQLRNKQRLISEEDKASHFLDIDDGIQLA